MKALDLLPDGRVAIRDGDREWVLRRPKLREWREIMQDVEGVDAVVTAAQIPADETPAAAEAAEASTRLLIRGSDEVPPAYAGVLARIVTRLSGAEVDPLDLPVWATVARPLGLIMAHWREVPLDLGPAPTN